MNYTRDTQQQIITIMGSMPVGVERRFNYLTPFHPVCRVHDESMQIIIIIITVRPFFYIISPFHLALPLLSDCSILPNTTHFSNLSFYIHDQRDSASSP